MEKIYQYLGLGIILILGGICFFTIKVADNKTKTLYDVLMWNIETRKNTS